MVDNKHQRENNDIVGGATYASVDKTELSTFAMTPHTPRYHLKLRQAHG